MKSLWEINFGSRTNLVGIVSILLGVAKMLFSDHIDLEYGPVELITFGLGIVYLREGMKDVDSNPKLSGED